MQQGGGQVVLGGDNVSSPVKIGLTDPPKSGGVAASPLPLPPPHTLQIYITKEIYFSNVLSPFIILL